MQDSELGGINPEPVQQVPDVSHPSPPNFTQVLAHDRAPTTRPPGLNPRVGSDSALILGQNHGNSDTTSQFLPHGQRCQRNLSVGSQQFSNQQKFEPDPTNSAMHAPRNAAEIPLNNGETFEDYFGAFPGAPGTASGLGYDGTKPIAYIRVNDPRRYLSRSKNDAPDPHDHSTSSQARSPNQIHPKVDWTFSQPKSQPLPTEEVAHIQQLTSHGPIANQPSVRPHLVGFHETYATISQAHAPAPDLLSYPNPQLTAVSKPSLEHQQGLPNRPTTALSSKGQDLNESQSAKTYYNSMQTDPDMDGGPQAPNKVEGGSRVLNTQEFVSSASCALVHPPMHIESALASVVIQGLEFPGPDYNTGFFHDGLPGQLLTQGTIGNTPDSNSNSTHYSEENLPPYPTVYDSERSSFNQSLSNPSQPSASSNYLSPSYCTHPRSRSPSIPTVGGNHEPMPIVAVPTPQRFSNFGAFLTPDPPYQTSNIDLPRRPGTSPPRQSSVPDGKYRLAPNTGRRQSEQTWRLYGSQFDRIQLPPVPSCNPGSRNDFRGEHTHAPPISAGPQMQTWMQALDRRGDNYAVATYGPISTQTSDSRPLPSNISPSQPLVQRPSATDIPEGLRVRKPGQSYGCAPMSSTLRRKQSKHHHMLQQNRLNPGQMGQQPNVQTPSAAPATQCQNVQDQINRRPQDLISESFMQPTLATAEAQSFGETATKRRYNHSNPEDTGQTKKQKVAGNNSEVIITQTDTLVPPNQYQQQNPPIDGHDCVYFNVNTWRGDDVIKQPVQQSDLAGSNTQTQPQDRDGAFVEHSLGEPTGAMCGTKSENLPSSEPFQGYYAGGGSTPERWLPVLQHTAHLPDWASSNLSLDQSPEFNIGVAAKPRGMEQYVTVLDEPERPGPEASTRLFSLIGRESHSEIEHFLVDYNWSTGAVFA